MPVAGSRAYTVTGGQLPPSSGAGAGHCGAPRHAAWVPNVGHPSGALHAVEYSQQPNPLGLFAHAITVSHAPPSEGVRGAGQSRHPMIVHAHCWFAWQVHVLQPSPAGFVWPGVQVGGLQLISVQPHSWSAEQLQVLQPSPAGLV
jgi:hypothetical protein